jgi:hypothetical protein
MGKHFLEEIMKLIDKIKEISKNTIESEKEQFLSEKHRYIDIINAKLENVAKVQLPLLSSINGKRNYNCKISFNEEPFLNLNDFQIAQIMVHYIKEGFEIIPGMLLNIYYIRWSI